MSHEELLAMLALFSVADDVFTEDDAFQKKAISLGRIYRAWKDARTVLDPLFNSNDYAKPRGE